MFQLEPSPTFTAPVAIPLPGGETATIDFIFKHKKKAAFQQFVDSIKDQPELATCAEVVSGWANVNAEYSIEALESMLDNYHGAALAILQSYIRELTGARVKN